MSQLIFSHLLPISGNEYEKLTYKLFPYVCDDG